MLSHPVAGLADSTIDIADCTSRSKLIQSIVFLCDLLLPCRSLRSSCRRIEQVRDLRQVDSVVARYLLGGINECRRAGMMLGGTYFAILTRPLRSSSARSGKCLWVRPTTAAELWSVPSISNVKKMARYQTNMNMSGWLQRFHWIVISIVVPFATGLVFLSYFESQ